MVEEVRYTSMWSKGKIMVVGEHFLIWFKWNQTFLKVLNIMHKLFLKIGANFKFIASLFMLEYN